MRALLTALLVLALATPAMADFSGPGANNTPPPPPPAGAPGPGGFKGPQPRALTAAAQVRDAHEDTPVNLVGNLVEQIAPDKYVFRDRSGTVVVDIDHKKFRGQNVTPRTRVRIIGEVDYEHGNREVDVDYLEIVR